ncbi:MAG: helix-turn-helix domain-containing protein [Bacteroidales bacterium]|jgi:DNA-binding CsgD family transcriptional regulator|nr:helix-turn-helix domain-containing protein [Bacteroidales bacterium]
MDNFDYYIRKPWNVPRALEKMYNTEVLEDVLYTLNQFQAGCFYILDYYRYKLIVDSPTSRILCGYPKELAQKEGLDFFRRITDKSRLALRVHRDKEFFNIFFRYPESYRRNFVLTNDIVVEDINKEELIFHHKIVPYKLDKNGNMWLALCFCSAFPEKTEDNRSMIVNSATGERYEFMNGSFVLSDTDALTQEELMILEWMAKELSAEYICDQMKISESSLKRKKQKIYTKLGVLSSSGAIRKAHLMGII